MMLGKNYFNTHRTCRFLILLCCMGMFAGLFYLNGRIERNERKDISNLQVFSYDKEIRVQWELPYPGTAEAIQVLIMHEGECCIQESIPSWSRSYSFQGGIPGELYSVRINAVFQNGECGEIYEKKLLFLDYDNLPDIPLMIIDTAFGEEPAYKEAEKPNEDFGGATLVENDYVYGRMEFAGADCGNVSSKIKVRIRGNTSSAGSEKKSYKIVLDEAVNLFGGEEESPAREWILLNTGTSLKNYMGGLLGDLCGVEWQTNMMFVNVMMNGDWKGCYVLVKAVSKDNSEGKISDSGFLFENDAYFWNADGIYFKTASQIDALGYTFKYPDIVTADDERMAALQGYMQEFEDCILSGDPAYRDYIDEESYASWILARDILGNSDEKGSNMFFYKYDYDPSAPTSTKVKMGPLWDFDAVFMCKDEWSRCRWDIVSFFPQMFEQESFRNIYVSKWEEMSGTLQNDVEVFLTQLYQSKGEAIDESWQLDAHRWSGEVVSLSEQIDEITGWFEERIEWMNAELEVQ